MRLLKFAAVFATLLLTLAACGDDAADDTDGDATEDVSDGEDPTGDLGAADDGRGAELDDEVAAIVNGEEVSSTDVEAQVEAFAANPQIAEALQGGEGDAALGVLRAQVVSTMIINHVAVASAEELGVPIGEEDIAAARAELEEETGGSEALAAAMEAEGMSEAQLTAQLRALAALRNIEQALAEEGDGSQDGETGENGVEVRAQQFVSERLLEADVVVNDDYGTWDPQTGQVAPPGGMPQMPQEQPPPES